MKNCKFAAMLLLLAALMLAGAPAAAAQGLDATVEKLTRTSGLKASYTVSSGGHTSSGTLLSAAGKFHLTSPEMTVWFDGRTQWAYSPQLNEVTILEPTPEELAQINPLALIQGLKDAFKAVKLQAPRKGESLYRLTPKSPSAEFRQATVTISDATKLPTALTATLADGTSLRVTITQLTLGVKPAAGAFTFTRSQLPHAAINDLR